MGGGGGLQTTHIATFTPDMSLGFSSLKVRTNWKKKSALRNLKLAQNKYTHKQKKIDSWWGFKLKSCQIPHWKKAVRNRNENQSRSSVYQLHRKISFCFHFTKVMIRLTNVAALSAVSEQGLKWSVACYLTLPVLVGPQVWPKSQAVEKPDL